MTMMRGGWRGGWVWQLRSRTDVAHNRDRHLAAVVTLVLGLAAIADRLYPLVTAMPVAHAWAAAIPWIISGVSALASMYGQNKAGQQQKAAANQQNAITQEQIAQARALAPYGTQMLDAARGAYGQVLPYYTKLAAGDRSQLLQLLSPELRGIQQNYDLPLQRLGDTAPRTGATASGRLGLISARAQALNNTLMSGRQIGMGGLQSLGGDFAKLGLGAEGSLLGGLSGAASSNLGLLGQLYGIRNQNYTESQDMGRSLADFYRAYQGYGGSQPPPSTLPTPNGNTNYWQQQITPGGH